MTIINYLFCEQQKVDFGRCDDSPQHREMVSSAFPLTQYFAIRKPFLYM